MEWTPDARELADLELLLSGAYQPLTGFLGHDDLHSVRENGTLRDGTPWPAPVTLHIPG
ncbi:MAG: adenylyl-sulfate kinase, partial [Nonomuraea sp.]|nr:adenylyl-sulfate kinase [Nonomuraea sp.]